MPLTSSVTPARPLAAVRPAPELSIIVPTFNERTNVPLLVERLERLLTECDWEVVFVDDNSPDGTAAAARAIGEGDSRYLQGGSAAGLSRQRSRVSRWSNALVRLLLGIDLTDPMSGYFMIRRDAFEALAPLLSSQGFKILTTSWPRGAAVCG